MSVMPLLGSLFDKILAYRPENNFATLRVREFR